MPLLLVKSISSRTINGINPGVEPWALFSNAEHWEFYHQMIKPERFMSHEEIKPITMPGIHDSVHRYVRRFLHPQDNLKILDVGAGHGAFTKRLHEEGFSVEACDMYPEYFRFAEIQCRQADITKELPYEDERFDVLLLIEVMEHIHDHANLFSECHRILRKGGIMFFSTPNIMSLKSRVRFLFTGFFYAFKPVDHQNQDGLQHLSSLTVDQYTNLTLTSGFSRFETAIDKRQKSSRWLSFLIPFIWLSTKHKGYPFELHNHSKYLFGRLLFFKLFK